MSIYKEQFDKLHTSVTAESLIAVANAESHKKKINKAIAIPVALAAAMSILVVSVGAATNWDINSLFANYNDTRQTISAETKTLTNWYLERDKYDTDGSELYKETDNYEDIMSKIVHPVDKLCEYDNMDIYIQGYAYDGNILEMYFDVTPKNVPLFADLNDYYAWMYSYVEPADKSSGGDMTLYATEGNTKKYMYRFYYRLPEGVNESLYLLYPHDLYALEVPEKEWGQKYIDYAFTIEKPDIPEYMIETDPDITIETTDGRHADVEYLLISPISVEFAGKWSDGQDNLASIDPTPVFIEYDDGEVLDLSSWTSSGSNWAAGQYNGETGIYKYIDTNGNILDVTHIKNIRLFDKTIEIIKQ